VSTPARTDTTGDRVPAGYRTDWALFTDWCAATGVAAICWHHRHCPTGPPGAGIPDRRALRASLGRPPPAPTRPPPDPEALAAAVRALPTTGWTGGFFGRRDAAVLTLAASPLPWTALAGLRTGDLSVAAGVLHLPGGHRLPAAPDPASCPPCVWLRWARALGLARREVSIRVLRAALDRAVPLTSTSPHRCRTTPAPDPGGDVGGEAVFTPIDQHGYPALDRALAPTSLARLAARHLDGRPPVRRIMAPVPRPAESESPALSAPAPPAAPSAATLQADHRHALDRRRDDLRQLDALDRLLAAPLERQADRANQQITALDWIRLDRPKSSPRAGRSYRWPGGRECPPSYVRRCRPGRHAV
jgi:hypothetical protein